MKKQWELDPAIAPGHTDLMVSPESLDVWLEANPLPKSDPTNAERQRRYRRRHKLGLEPVKVRGVVYLVPPNVASWIAIQCREAEDRLQSELSRNP